MDVYLEGECMDIEFSSVKQLYDRLLPALKTKELDLKRNNINYIKKEDIWNYLKITKWKSSSNLTLGEMVNDIIKLEPNDIDKYLKEQMKNEKKEKNNKIN